MLDILKFEENEVRVEVDENGDPLFCASDVARCLGYKEPGLAVRTHCKTDGGAKRTVIDSLGRKQEANFIRESDVYRLVFSSKLPGAQKFMDWITEEVIPSIRKTGGYVVKQLTTLQIIEMARDAEIKRLAAEEEVKKLTPYAQVGKAFAEHEGSARIGQFAKCICVDGRVMGQNKMFDFLKEIRFLSPSNEPYQTHVDAGRAYLKQGSHMEGDEEVSHFTPMLTIKGQCYIVTKLQDHPSFIGKSVIINSRVLNIVPLEEG
jgi:anti-repressor protein